LVARLHYTRKNKEKYQGKKGWIRPFPFFCDPVRTLASPTAFGSSSSRSVERDGL